MRALSQASSSAENEPPLPEGHDSSPPAPLRSIQPPLEHSLPLYVQEHGTRISLAQGCLKIQPRSSAEETLPQVGLHQLSQLNLFGGVQITTQALQACLRADLPVNFFSGSGWYYGRAISTENRQVHIRLAQFETFRSSRALEIARQLIADKIANCRTLLRRNAAALEGCSNEIRQLKRLTLQAEAAPSFDSLLGVEGEAARRYWSIFSPLLAQTHESFEMKGRNRRPPRDPSNALLSLGYSLLVKDCTIAAANAGLDPFLGMYHTPHHGRPSIALDLMEPFRPLIVDSIVLQVVRRAEIQPDDFLFTGQAVALKPQARKAFLRAYERRIDDLITHPVFGYRISYRRVLHVQARLLARTFTREIPTFPSFRTR